MSEKPKGFMEGLRHAFHVEKGGVAAPDEATAKVVWKICVEIERRDMVLPAMMLLEMSRPLNFIGAQTLHFFQPFGTVLIDPGAWERFATFLEKRGSVEYLIQRLEDVKREAVEGSEDSSDEGDSATL